MELENDVPLESFIEIYYGTDEDKIAVRLDVNEANRIIFLMVNRDGAAHLANIAIDFLLDLAPDTYVFRLDSKGSLSAGSPELVFEFDAALNETSGRALLMLSFLTE